MGAVFACHFLVPFVTQDYADLGELFSEVFVPQALVGGDVFEVFLIVLGQMVQYLSQILSSNDLIIPLLKNFTNRKGFLAPLPKVLNLVINHLLEILEELNSILIDTVKACTAVLMDFKQVFNLHQLAFGLEYFLTTVRLLAAKCVMVALVADAGHLCGPAFRAFQLDLTGWDLVH